MSVSKPTREECIDAAARAWIAWDQAHPEEAAARLRALDAEDTAASLMGEVTVSRRRG